jgi:cell division protease FtsH
MSSLGPDRLRRQPRHGLPRPRHHPHREFSEETARRIDVEIHRIITEQYERAKAIITERRAALDKIAEALLEHETIEGRHVLEILQFGEIRSPVIRPSRQAPTSPRRRSWPTSRPRRGPRRRPRPPDAGLRPGGPARAAPFTGLDLAGLPQHGAAP